MTGQFLCYFFPVKLISKHMESHSEAQIAWINAFIGRIFWDFLCEKYWADLVAHKIQKKLGKIRVSLRSTFR